MAPIRTLLIRGPFAENELALFISVAQQIEADHPEHTYEVVIDGLDTEDQIETIYAKVPPSPGYQRIRIDTPLEET